MVKIPIFGDVFGSSAGEITVDNDQITVRHKELKMTVPLGYLYEVQLVEKKELGKVRASIVVFDTIGIRNTVDCILSEPNYFLLKSFIKKQ